MAQQKPTQMNKKSYKNQQKTPFFLQLLAFEV
jgi:hypothetical protein